MAIRLRSWANAPPRSYKYSKSNQLFNQFSIKYLPSSSPNFQSDQQYALQRLHYSKLNISYVLTFSFLILTATNKIQWRNLFEFIGKLAVLYAPRVRIVCLNLNVIKINTNQRTGVYYMKTASALCSILKIEFTLIAFIIKKQNYKNHCYCTLENVPK